MSPNSFAPLRFESNMEEKEEVSTDDSDSDDNDGEG